MPGPIATAALLLLSCTVPRASAEVRIEGRDGGARMLDLSGVDLSDEKAVRTAAARLAEQMRQEGNFGGPPVTADEIDVGDEYFDAPAPPDNDIESRISAAVGDAFGGGDGDGDDERRTGPSARLGVRDLVETWWTWYSDLRDEAKTTLVRKRRAAAAARQQQGGHAGGPPSSAAAPDASELAFQLAAAALVMGGLWYWSDRNQRREAAEKLGSPSPSPSPAPESGAAAPPVSADEAAELLRTAALFGTSTAEREELADELPELDAAERARLLETWGALSLGGVGGDAPPLEELRDQRRHVEEELRIRGGAVGAEGRELRETSEMLGKLIEVLGAERDDVAEAVSRVNARHTKKPHSEPKPARVAGKPKVTWKIDGGKGKGKGTTRPQPGVTVEELRVGDADDNDDAGEDDADFSECQ